MGKFPREKSPLFPKKFLFVGLGSFPSFPLKTFNKHGEVPSAKNPLFPKETPLCWIGELLSVPLKILQQTSGNHLVKVFLSSSVTFHCYGWKSSMKNIFPSSERVELFLQCFCDKKHLIGVTLASSTVEKQFC